MTNKKHIAEVATISKHIRYILLRYLPDSMPFTLKNIRDNGRFAEDEDRLMGQIEALLIDFIDKYKRG